MDASSLISQIFIAQKAEDLFTKTGFKKEYLGYMKTLHPDVCSHPQAHEAVLRLNEWRTHMEALTELRDDAGLWLAQDNTLLFKGDKTLLQRSLEGYQILMQRKDAASLHFQKYLPVRLCWEGDSLRAELPHRGVPLTHLTLPIHHVTWLASRMYEFTAWLHQSGFCHAGLTPDAWCIIPETHGAVCHSFYHLSLLGDKLRTISAKYQTWYPDAVFVHKKASPNIDLRLVQNTALYVLGDTSGNGVKLKKHHQPELIDFFIAEHTDAYQTFDDYRKLLARIFGKPKFFPLDI